MEVLSATSNGAIPEPEKRQKKREIFLTVRILPDGDTVKVRGREAWALNELIRAGSKGVTPLESPGPRWSAYVFDLRGFGIRIETTNEPHGGPFQGTHARYRLISELEIIDGNMEGVR